MMVAAASLIGVPLAYAHKASDAYLQVSEPGGEIAPRNVQGAFQLKYSVALRDLDANLDTLDQDNDRRLNWREVRAAMPAIESWAGAGFAIVCEDIRKPLLWSYDGLEQRSDGAYVRLQAMGSCASKATLAVQYLLMKEVDAGHRLLVSGQLGGAALASVIAPQNLPLKLSSGFASHSEAAVTGQHPGSQQGATFKRFFVEGFWHLSTGFDHLAFLLALILPISLSRSGLLGLLATVTTFTVGHSITLGLATYGWVASPVWVEPAITLSIALTALLNLVAGSKLARRSVGGWVRLANTRWIALLFGLIHGLGFSGVMTEAGVDGSLLLWALGGFNLGLEAAQLLAVAAWLALCFGLSRTPKFKPDYWPVLVRGGSVSLLLLAVVWTAQRII
jgi:hypothetical protein